MMMNLSNQPNPFNHWLTHPLTLSLTHHLLTHSFTHSLIHSLTHKRTDVFFLSPVSVLIICTKNLTPYWLEQVAPKRARVCWVASLDRCLEKIENDPESNFKSQKSRVTHHTSTSYLLPLVISYTVDVIFYQVLIGTYHCYISLAVSWASNGWRKKCYILTYMHNLVYYHHQQYYHQHVRTFYVLTTIPSHLAHADDINSKQVSQIIFVTTTITSSSWPPGSISSAPRQIIWQSINQSINLTRSIIR